MKKYTHYSKTVGHKIDKYLKDTRKKVLPTTKQILDWQLNYQEQ